MKSLTTSQMANVLCIDDETAALAVRKRVLESAGHQVSIANNGAEGIRLFQSQSFDIVILDYWMSSMNGIATARQLKRLNKSIPIIIFSGLSQLPDEIIGVADRWILKDEGPEFLLSAMKDLLKFPS